MELDYAKLGFKCGIEIHQQLDTCKLFCPCPSVIRDEKPDYVVGRRMRAVAGETGNVDPAALHEFLRGRKLTYESYDGTNCLVELDEEPPHPLNAAALKIAIEVALLLKARLVDEIHVMRKTVIDGSNTSGFQRTMLIATDGVIDTDEGPIRIPTVCLEEDAARIMEEGGETVHYRLDRLGIPLIEIATSPDIKSPRHARETAEKIGGILRAAKVKRGLGTIRQDINVSITGGQRIEVKGVQDLRLISKIGEGEVERQIMLLACRDELHKRGVTAADYKKGWLDVTETFKDTQSAVIRKGLESPGRVLGVRLKGMECLLKGKLGPQLAQYARAMAGVKGIFHGDELPAYGISPKEVSAVKERMAIASGDSYVLVCGASTDADKALTAVMERCQKALLGVPDEVRRPKEDGSSEFMRPLPGSFRMYPETDEPFVTVSKDLVKGISSSLPELREDKAKRYEEIGLGHEMASQLSKSAEAPMFEMFVAEFPSVSPTSIAQTLSATPKEAAKRHGSNVQLLSESHFRQMFNLLSDGRVSKNVLAELMAKVCEKPEADVGETAKANGLTNLTDAEIKTIISSIVSANPGLKPPALMGKVMAATKGRADPAKVQALLKA